MIVAFVLILIYRLGYGLTEKFWDTDELQSYLIGLRAYAAGEWPAWGPDSMYKVPSRLAGGLMGSIIMLALRLAPFPESPIVLLNLLSFAALLFLGWFLTKQLKQLPAWLIWIYVLTSPWTLHFSTYIINPSFVLVGAVCFFIPFMDRTHLLGDRPLLDTRLAYALMGFALMWVFQVHMSWVLIGPFGIWLMIKEHYTLRSFATATVSFLFGAMLASITLLPTLDALLNDPLGGTENNVVFNAKNLLYLPEFIGRYLAMGSFEIARYTSHIELLFQQIEQQPWVIPLAAVLILFSLLQVLLVLFFLITNKEQGARKLKFFLMVSGGLVFTSFLFSIKPPISYTFYFTFPLILALSLSIYSYYQHRWPLKPIFAWLFLLSIGFHVAHGFFGFGFKSIYTDRERAVLAIDQKEHLLMGARRVAYFEKPDRGKIFTNQKNAAKATFEYVHAPTRPQYISGQRSSEGNFALVMTDRAPYSPSFELLVDERAHELQLRIDYWSLTTDTLTWVMERSEDNFWKAVQIILEPSIGNDWRTVTATLGLPVTNETTPFKGYLWKEGNAMNLIYIDDLTIEPSHAVGEEYNR
jgi:hypothetical protein